MLLPSPCCLPPENPRRRRGPQGKCGGSFPHRNPGGIRPPAVALRPVASTVVLGHLPLFMIHFKSPDHHSVSLMLLVIDDLDRFEGLARPSGKQGDEADL